MWVSGHAVERIRYLHVAGHYRESDDLLVDTHGAAVVDPVWNLLEFTYEQHGQKPTLLERDFNIPPVADLVGELNTIRAIQNGDDRTSDSLLRENTL